MDEGGWCGVHVRAMDLGETGGCYELQNFAGSVHLIEGGCDCGFYYEAGWFEFPLRS